MTDKLLASSTIPETMYGLPKIHKEKIPSRSILSAKIPGPIIYLSI